jgi:hypothetical protein
MGGASSAARRAMRRTSEADGRAARARQPGQPPGAGSGERGRHGAGLNTIALDLGRDSRGGPEFEGGMK